MADEPINELITIADGSSAEAKPLRQNFTYLQSLITQQQSGLDNKLSASAKGAANGVCPLNSSKKIDSSYIDFNGATSVIDSRINSQCVKLTGNQTVGGNKTFTGANTFNGTTKVPPSTAAGTALCNSASSYSSPGHIKFGNGVMIQWGKYKNTSQTQEHTLPQAFKNTSYIVTRAHQGTSYEQKWAGGSVSISSESKIKITVGNDLGDGFNTFIIAIGRWN